MAISLLHTYGRKRIDPAKIVRMSFGLNSSFFITASGRVFNCGNNQYGQLGRLVANGSQTVCNLAEVQELDNVQNVNNTFKYYDSF